MVGIARGIDGPFQGSREFLHGPGQSPIPKIEVISEELEYPTEVDTSHHFHQTDWQGSGTQHPIELQHRGEGKGCLLEDVEWNLRGQTLMLHEKHKLHSIKIHLLPR